MTAARFSYHWWRNLTVEILVALFLTLLVIQISGMVSQRQKELLPASAWFEINDIFVPDHTIGSNPQIIYDRIIHEAFTGFWIVEVQRVGDDGLYRPVCSGSGVSRYELDETLDPSVVTWEWMIGRPCLVPPGQYRLRVSYKLEQPGWPTKEAFATSNWFFVTDLEAPFGRLRQ